MSFSIDTFRSGALNAGGARANLFDVTMTGPTAAGLTISEMNYSCKGASIPPMTVGVVEVPYFGRVVKVPGNKTFDNWTTTVINDEGFEVRNAMEKWMTAMGTHEGNFQTIGGGATGGVSSLYGSASVSQYGKASDTALQTYYFVNIFPVNLSEIALAWDSNDAIEEFTVEFAYDYWTSTKGSTAIVT
jgi:hypothetical protein